MEGEAVREVIDAWGFKNEQGQRLVALWMKSDAEDNNINQGTQLHLRIGAPAEKVVGIDTLNGVEQDLKFERDGQDTWIRDLLVYDYPLIVRME